jgi:GntR family transcriptional regulator/MocR family aminotransferase
LDLFLDPEAPRTATRALFEQLRDSIVSGRLAEGDRLPPSRSVAAQLGVSRHTITTVYGRLAAEGFIEGRSGGGSFVCRVAGRSQARRSTTALHPVPAVPLQQASPTDDWSASSSARFDLRPGAPDPSLFPLAQWRRCMTTALQVSPPGYGDPAGLPALRRVVARWVGRSRAVEADPEQVVITAGAQQAVDLVFRLVVRPGQVVAVEDPGYPPIRRLCRALGMVVEPVPVDAEGIVVDQIPRRARVVYTTPSHQSPTGATTSLRRRRALLAFAERHDIAIIEDDYDSEYRHVDRPLEPLFRLDHAGRVIYVGTFSKTLSPSLRLGFAVLPVSLAAAAVELKTVMDMQPPASMQAALAHFIADGALDRHLRRTRKIYSERHRLVSTFVEGAVSRGALVPIASNVAGLHMAALLPDGVSESTVLAASRQRGVAIGGLAPWWLRPNSPGGLVIGFGEIGTAQLPTALDIVDDVLAVTTPKVR